MFWILLVICLLVAILVAGSYMVRYHALEEQVLTKFRPNFCQATLAGLRRVSPDKYKVKHDTHLLHDAFVINMEDNKDLRNVLVATVYWAGHEQVSSKELFLIEVTSAQDIFFVMSYDELQNTLIEWIIDQRSNVLEKK